MIVATHKATGEKRLLAISEGHYDPDYPVVTTDEARILAKTIDRVLFEWAPDRPVRIWYSNLGHMREGVWRPS